MRRTNMSRSDSVRDGCCRDRGIDFGRPATTWPCSEATRTESAVLLTILFYDTAANSDLGFLSNRRPVRGRRTVSGSPFRTGPATAARDEHDQAHTFVAHGRVL